MLSFSKKINDNELKEFGEYLIKDTCNRIGLDVNVIISKLEKFYKSKQYKKYNNESFEGVKGISSSSNEEIVIITDNIEDEYQIIDYMFVIFHEIMHTIIYQKETSSDEYDKTMFSIDLENRIINNNEKRYNKYGEMFREEIEADIFATKVSQDYGINKMIEFMTKKGKKLKEKEIKKYSAYLELMNLYNEYRINAYNVCVSIDYYNMLIKKNPKLLTDSSFLLNQFYNKDGTYKSILEIMNDPTINKHDFDIRSYILASRSFLKEVDFNNISYFQLNYLLKSLEYVYKEELKKSNKCEKIKEYEKKLSEKSKKELNNKVEDTFQQVYWVNTSPKKYNYLKNILNKYNRNLKAEPGQIKPVKKSSRR